MSDNKPIPSSKTYKLFWSLTVVACLILIAVNYYSLDIIAGTQSVLKGESYYSKAQKSAVQHLYLFLDTRQDIHWKEFQEDIATPLYIREARIFMDEGNLTEAEDMIIKAGLNKEDAEDIIWFYSNFKNTEILSPAINIWKTGDEYIMKLNEIGKEVHGLDKRYEINEENELMLKADLNTLSRDLTNFERLFIREIAKSSNNVNKALKLINIILIMVILFTGSLIVFQIIRQLLASEQSLTIKNKELKSTNKELDKFLYSASHDLRAPITSLKGLISIIREEFREKALHDYLNMMEKNLDSQELFIQKIISYSKNKKLDIEPEEIDLGKLIRGIIDDLRFAHSQKLEFELDLGVNSITTDRSRINIILQNLLSNSIRYSDPDKPKSIIRVSTSKVSKGIAITLEDNGLGIERKHLDKVFHMFFTTDTSKGTGLGLYIVKDTVEKLGGNIHVNSKMKVGTVFEIFLPQL